LGFRLPTDYKDYVSLYGAGRWADFFAILSPFYEWKQPQTTDYFDWIRTRLDGLDEMHQSFPHHAPPFYRHPAPGGLVPIGYTDNGGTLCWQTIDEPDSWTIVCFAGKFSLGYDKFPMCLTGFLAELLEGNISLKTFPSDFFPIPKPTFEPYATQ
jgi:hypothetical protein